MNLRSAPFLLVALLAAAPSAPALGAEGAPVAGSSQPASPARATPWSLSLEAHGLAVDEAAVRSAVARELERAGVVAGSDPVRITVFVAEGANLQVRYRSPAGAELSRSVAAPVRADEVPEASALLVGNLARDEAGALLARLRQPDQAASEPPASPSVSLPAAPAPAETAREVPPVLPLDSVNFSLAYPITLRSDTARRHLACELGLFYSRTAAVSGLSLTALGVSRVDGPAHGVQIGLIGYWHAGAGAGVRLGTFFGASAGSFEGLSATAFASVHRGALVGAELGGLTSIATGPLDGLQMSGLLDYAGAVRGVQVAGLASISDGPIAGVQAAGWLSTAEAVRGLQLSLLNIGGSVKGAQIGLVNVADDVTGAQIGLVNVARSVEGQSIGLIPYNHEGGLKIATWYATTQPFNMGVRFHAGALYIMPTFAFDPGSAALVSEPSHMRYAIGTSIGLRLPLDRAFVDFDVNQSQRSSGWEYMLDEEALDLRYRVLAGYRVVQAFGVFAGGGVRHHFPDGGPRGGSLQPELTVGMEML